MQLRADFFVHSDGFAFPKAKPISGTLRLEIWERDGRKCQICRREVEPFGNVVSPFTKPCAAIDHIFPRARGGQNDRWNLRLLCISCNAAKGAR